MFFFDFSSTSGMGSGSVAVAVAAAAAAAASVASSHPPTPGAVIPTRTDRLELITSMTNGGPGIAHNTTA